MIGRVHLYLTNLKMIIKNVIGKIIAINNSYPVGEHIIHNLTSRVTNVNLIPE